MKGQQVGPEMPPVSECLDILKQLPTYRSNSKGLTLFTKSRDFALGDSPGFLKCFYHAL